MTADENIAEIFRKDPLALTVDDLRAIVAHYQRFQGQFGKVAKDGTVMVDEEIKKVRKRVKKPKADPRQIDLELDEETP